MYNYTAYVKKILEANDMLETDIIYPGQEIIIPTIN